MFPPWMAHQARRLTSPTYMPGARFFYRGPAGLVSIQLPGCSPARAISPWPQLQSLPQPRRLPVGWTSVSVISRSPWPSEGFMKTPASHCHIPKTNGDKLTPWAFRLRGGSPWGMCVSPWAANPPLSQSMTWRVRNGTQPLSESASKTFQSS